MKTLTLIALAACVFVLTSLNGVAAVECDRACLSSLATRYIDSLVAHDPRTLPLSDRVRFTDGEHIHAVEAFQKVLPTGTKSGWD
jgi:hypothetical protein